MTTPLTLVRGAWVLTMDAAEPAIRDGAVLFSDDGAIVAVGTAAELRALYPQADVVGDDHAIVLPGFVNAHTHLTEGLLSGMAETASLWEWAERVILPAGRVLTRDDVRVGARLKAAEMLLSGITTVSEMSCHYNPGSLASLGAADGLSLSGLRGIVSFGPEDRYTVATGDVPGDASPVAFMAEHEALADRVAHEPLLGFRIGIGTVLGISDELFARTVDACKVHGWAVHTHLAEVREEVTAAHVRFGWSTIEQAGRAGLLDHDVLAAHCIWCSERDIGLLATRHVSVAHNPVANMILGSGVCPVPRLHREGIAVGLGTDGAASNDSQDMFGAIKSAALLQKITALDPRAITAAEVLRMATIEGARALHLDHLIGSLTVGKRADLLLLNGNTPELATIHDPWQQVVYCATPRCVSHVWIDGACRVRDGRLVGADVAMLAAEARVLACDLVVRAGLSRESVYAGAVPHAAPRAAPTDGTSQ